MADAAAPAKGLGATLAKKVGPFPLGVWAAAGVGAIWYMERKKSAAAASPAAQQSQTGYGTDPAGNTGYIDPSTGYVYGSAEDISALQNQGLVGQNSYNTGGTGDTSGTGGTADSGAGSTTPPVADTSGQTTGTTNPSGTSVTTPGAPAGPTVVTAAAAAPKSTSWRYPAPTGLQASAVSDSGYSISWNPV